MLWTDSDFSCNSTGERILCLRVAWGGGEGVGESYFVKANIEKFYFFKPYAWIPPDLPSNSESGLSLVEVHQSISESLSPPLQSLSPHVFDWDKDSIVKLIEYIWSQ